MPLLFTIYGFWPMWEKYRAAKKMEEQMGEEMAEKVRGAIVETVPVIVGTMAP